METFFFSGGIAVIRAVIPAATGVLDCSDAAAVPIGGFKSCGDGDRVRALLLELPVGESIFWDSKADAEARKNSGISTSLINPR